MSGNEARADSPGRGWEFADAPRVSRRYMRFVVVAYLVWLVVLGAFAAQTWLGVFG